MQMVRYGPYSAWITIEGVAQDVYDVCHSGNLATCWTASKSGKKFAVNWYNSMRDIPLKACLYIDGVHCDTHIMLDSHNYPHKPSGVGVSYARTSKYTRRDFVFSPLRITDDDSYFDYVDYAKELGVIKLQLWRVEVLQMFPQIQEYDHGMPVLGPQVVHERSKKAGSHHVLFGKEYISPAPVVDSVEIREIDPKPYLIFEFKYKPLELLIADEIAPKPSLFAGLYTLSPTPEPVATTFI